MKHLTIADDWLKKLLPEDFPYPSSTLISGPGGTGKPLVEFAFIASWLKAGGAMIGIPLQYQDTAFLKTAMNKLYGVDLDDFLKKIVYLQLAPGIERHQESGNTIKANLLDPAVWNETIAMADDMIEKSDLGTMVFSSALNLLLFSPTYREDTVKNLVDILKHDKSKTYIFSVSTSAYADKIEMWERAADNLMFTRMEKPMRLYCRITKMKEVAFLEDEVPVPIAKEMLMEIKDVAEMTRKRIIPEIMEI
jgi:KaiC/GvpD/RAD55 family RecA-like ATPase